MQKSITKTAPKTAAIKAPAKRGTRKPKAAAPAATDVQAVKLTASERGITRDAATVLRQATNFNALSDRDVAYIRFFGETMRANGGTATLAQLVKAGTQRDGKAYNPYHGGSAKATDGGAINRLIKAQLITASSDGHTFTATDAIKTHAAYNGK